MRRTAGAAAAVAIALALGVPPPVTAQPARGDAPAEPGRDFRPVRGGVYLLDGDAGNVVASVGEDGVLLVDTGIAGAAISDALARLEERLAYDGSLDAAARQPGRAEATASLAAPDRDPRPAIRHIVNTGPRPAQTGGNAALVAATASDRAVGVIAHENVLVRLVSAGAPFEMLPTHTVAAGTFDLADGFNGEAVRLVHLPAASTDGDLLVYFRGSDVICSGAVFSMETFPVIDIARGGSIDGSIQALNRILSLAIPGASLDGGTLIVPGNGRLADSADVGRYRDMLAIIRDQIQYSIDAGMSLAQVQAADPTAGFDGRFGADSGAWTTAMFVEAVYRSLDQAP